MATAYVATISVRNAQGANKTYNFTASDVTTEHWLAPSGEGALVLTAAGGAVTDVIVSSGAGDTSQVLFYVNGQNSGKIIYKALNLATAVGGRQIQMMPLTIPPGATIAFVQLT